MVQDDTANVTANPPAPPGTGPQPPVVAIVVYDGLALFELAAANDVFGSDITTASGQPLYQVLICGPAQSVMTEAGFRMEVPHGLDALDQAHTIVVLPTLFPERVPAAVLDALRLAGSRGQRLVSLCTGAFVLAAAGLLDGRTATHALVRVRRPEAAVPAGDGRPGRALRGRRRAAHLGRQRRQP